MSGRVLVSSRGEGNWSGTDNQLDAVESIYFPPGTGSAAPTSSQDLTNNINFIGWETKSNWIAQAKIVDGTNATVAIYVMRPSGVEALSQTGVSLILATGPLSITIGGVADELVVGPASYFRFECTVATGSPKVDCFVIGWNEGDIIS